MRNRGIQIRVVTYESILADPVAELEAILGYAPNANAIAEVMSRDSQSDALYAQGGLESASSDMQGYDDFLKEWQAKIDPACLKRLGLDLELQPL